MAKRNRTIGSIRAELLRKSRDATLCAIKTFNDPLVTFKSENFIVLMIIAWTYLLHAYYRSRWIEYRYYKQGKQRKVFDRTKRGAYKYWDLERCLNDDKSPVDPDTANNLRFLTGLRHEIEHQMTRSLDNYLSGRYQACVLNYNAHLKRLFPKVAPLDTHLTYSIQFVELSEEQLKESDRGEDLPKNLRAYIAAYDGALTHEQYNHPNYSYRLLFKRKLVNRPGQADKVIEFIDPKSDLAKQIDKEYWVKKEVERPKYRAKDVVSAVREAGFTGFRIQPDHVVIWKGENAKDPAKGYGVDVQGSWYWYESWVKRCIELCRETGDKYK